MRVSKRGKSVPDQRKSPEKMTMEGGAVLEAAEPSLSLHGLAPKRPPMTEDREGSGEPKDPANTCSW